MKRARRRLARAAYLAAALLVCARAGAELPVVVLLSWDGVRHDYPDRSPLPGLERMARDGVRAARLLPVFPTNTFPNHVSLATGAPADVHGIVGNTFRDTERGVFDYADDASWIDAEPIWVAAERQGLRAAAFFWVGSETDWQGVGASLRRSPFDSGIPESTKVEQILAWLDLPASERPRLILSWWHGADAAGHRRGPDDPGVAKQMRAQDAALVRLLAGLDARRVWDWLTLVLVSDHGMTHVSEGIDLAGLLARNGIAARVLPGGGVAHVALREAGQRDRALDVLAAIPGVRAWASDALPAALRYTRPGRNGDIVALADPPSAFLPASALRAAGADTPRATGLRRGGHGYAADHPDMSGVFLALGRCVPAGRVLGDVRVIDVAPTLAQLLSIQPPRHAEGQPIPGLSAAPPGTSGACSASASEMRGRSRSAAGRGAASPD
ncbi:MAG: alkaline phosphatase family protein [Deltaproteobacteria bacterium]|nr:MAG: alkaline phosphatase family protein [Deltaproteobacteria bacterium]